MLNKIKETLNENDSQLELITIKRKKTMTKETNKTNLIEVRLAQDLFIIAKQYEKKNQYIKAFTLQDDNFKLTKLPSGSKFVCTFGFKSHIESFETEEITAESTTIRKYKKHGFEYRLMTEVTNYTD